MKIVFKSRNDKQIQAARAWVDPKIQQLLYGGAKGGGKSFLGCAMIFGMALMYPVTHYFIARRALIDLRRHTIPSIKEFFQKVYLESGKQGLDINKYAKFNGQDHIYKLYNGSEVHLIMCDDRPSDPLFERFGSMQMTQGWIEEAGEVPEDAKENLWLSIGRWKNEDYDIPPKLLITANPKKGWLKRQFVDPAAQGLLAPSRCYIQAFAEDNVAYLGRSYVQKLHDDPNKVRRQRLAEGNWDYDDDDDALVTYDALSDAFSNTVDSDGKRYMTVDVARKGKDRSVIKLWDGLKNYETHTYQGIATTRLEQNITDIAALERVPRSRILVDEGGVGGGIVDHLPGVKGFNGSSTPIPTASQIRERKAKVSHDFIPKTTFANLRAQCGWKVAELINEHKIRLDEEVREETIEELSAMLRDRSPDIESKRLLRAKDSVIEEIGRSPDIGDTVLMRAWFELVEPVQEGVAISEEKATEVREMQEVRLNRRKRDHRGGIHSNR